MRLLHSVGGPAAVIASAAVSRMVLHALMEHGHPDVFHFIAAIIAAVAGLALLRHGLLAR